MARQESKPKLLGQSLQWLRESRQETIMETAGAIEVDAKTLERFEDGRDIPSEDLLELLFNHFEVDESQAVRMRRLAGYDDLDETNGQLVKMPVVLLGMDQRVIYSDGLHVEVNPSGVTMTFTQSGDQVIPVSRVGMSHVQAENVMKTLEQALLRLKYLNGPAALPPAKQNKKDEPKD